MPDAGRRDGPARGLGRPREIARRKDHAASLPGWRRDLVVAGKYSCTDHAAAGPGRSGPSHPVQMSLISRRMRSSLLAQPRLPALALSLLLRFLRRRVRPVARRPPRGRGALPRGTQSAPGVERGGGCTVPGAGAVCVDGSGTTGGEEGPIGGVSTCDWFGGVGTGAAGPDGVCVADGLAEGAEPPEVVPDDEPVWARAAMAK